MKTTIPAEVWERKRADISNLYNVEEWPLKQVIKKIRGPDFNPTETQLRSRLKKWGVTKPSRQKRKKTNQRKAKAPVVKAEEADETLDYQCQNNKVPLQPSPKGNDGWAFHSSPSYMLAHHSLMHNSEVRKSFAMRSTGDLTDALHDTRAHSVSQPAYQLSRHPLPQDTPYSRSVCMCNHALATASHNFIPSTQYESAIPSHIEPQDAEISRTPPSDLTPGGQDYTSPQQDQHSFSGSGYIRIPDLHYISPVERHAQAHCETSELSPSCYGDISPCDPQEPEPIPGLIAWRRASATVDIEGNYIAHPRVASRRPRVRKPRAGRKSPVPEWPMYPQLHSPEQTMMPLAPHPSLTHPSVKHEERFNGHSPDYVSGIPCGLTVDNS